MCQELTLIRPIARPDSEVVRRWWWRRKRWSSRPRSRHWLAHGQLEGRRFDGRVDECARALAARIRLKHGRAATCEEATTKQGREMAEALKVEVEVAKVKWMMEDAYEVEDGGAGTCVVEYGA